MKQHKTHVFSAIVILIISFSDEAKSKSLEIDRRLERAVEAWRNGTSLAQADTDTDTDGSNRQAGVIDPKTGIKYGCYWSHCWRSCKKGEQIINTGTQKDLCDHDDWCYSDLGRCTRASKCREAVKWGCYGTGTEPGRIVETGCPGFEGYLCDKETRISFGCDKGLSHCWRSCNSKKERNCNDKSLDGQEYCHVHAGYCSWDKRCIIATVLKCRGLADWHKL